MSADELMFSRKEKYHAQGSARILNLGSGRGKKRALRNGGKMIDNGPTCHRNTHKNIP